MARRTEQVLISHHNQAMCGDSGALVYKAAVLQQQQGFFDDNIDNPSVTAGMLWGGLGMSEDRRQVAWDRIQVNLGGLCFIIPFDAILEKALQSRLDQKYGVGQYRLSWSSDGSGSGADVDAVSHALAGMGIQSSLPL